MKTAREALDAGFTFENGYYEFAFGPIPGETYRLVFEPMLFDNQWYVKLCSEDGGVLTEPVVVKPGFERATERVGEGDGDGR